MLKVIKNKVASQKNEENLKNNEKVKGLKLADE